MGDRTSLRFAVSRTNGGPALLDGARQFAAALAKEVGAPVDLIVRYDYAALLKSVVSSSVELAWMPPLLHARAANEGARLVALSQRGGALGYRSALIVGRDCFTTVRDLVGIRAAWVDPHSSSGYIFPRMHLVAAGLDPQKTFASERFCGSATSACRLVATGEADLAACFLSLASDRAAAQLEVDRMFKTPSLRVLDITATIPPDGFVVSRAVDEETLRALRTALLALHTRPAGHAAMASLLQAERLAPVPAAVVRDLQRLATHAAE